MRILLALRAANKTFRPVWCKGSAKLARRRAICSVAIPGHPGKNFVPSAEAGHSGKNEPKAHKDSQSNSQQPSGFKHPQRAADNYQYPIANAGLSFKGNGHKNCTPAVSWTGTEHDDGMGRRSSSSWFLRLRKADCVPDPCRAVPSKSALVFNASRHSPFFADVHDGFCEWLRCFINLFAAEWEADRRDLAAESSRAEQNRAYSRGKCFFIVKNFCSDVS